MSRRRRHEWVFSTEDGDHKWVVQDTNRGAAIVIDGTILDPGLSPLANRLLHLASRLDAMEAENERLRTHESRLVAEAVVAVLIPQSTDLAERFLHDYNARRAALANRED